MDLSDEPVNHPYAGSSTAAVPLPDQSVDRTGDVLGEVFLEEVLAGQQDCVVEAGGELGLNAVASPAQCGVAFSPDDLHGVGGIADGGDVAALLVCGEFEAAHDLEEGLAAVVAEEQRHVAGDLGGGDVSADPDVAHEGDEDAGDAQCLQPCFADAGVGEGFHDPGAVEGFGGDDGVEHGQGQDPFGVCGGEFESDGAADVVHDEVEAVQVQGVDGGAHPAAQSGPAVVEVGGAFGQAEAG